MALLEMQDLFIDIQRQGEYYTAVNGINITINEGEIAALAGESGSGKSLSSLSVVRLLPTSARIRSGKILYHTATGEVVNLCSINEKHLRQIRGKEISMIFQEPRQSLNPLIRIGTQIAETLKLHGMDKNEAKGAALDMLQKLKFPEPEKILRSWPHQLSGGMCQRVMIAIAAICRPRLLIADEPVTALDMVNQNHILSLLKHINSEFGTAILFISHDLGVVRHFCSRFLVMYAGNIIEEGSAERILSSPLHPYTIGLAGAIPRKENRGRPLANIPGKAPSLDESLLGGKAVKGCPFSPRCQKAEGTSKDEHNCKTVFPPWVDTGEDHRVRCFFPGFITHHGGGNG